MRTAVKPLIFFGAGWCAATLLVANLATAQPELDSLPPPTGTAELPADLPPADMPAVSAPSLPDADMTSDTDVDAEKEQSQAKALQKASKKIEDQIKSLQAKPSDLNLEDLNKARATLARLDLLLEMEERLATLDELRQKRMVAAVDANAIPTSALTAPSAPSSANAVPPSFAPIDAPKRRAHYQVTKIVGVDGDYTAQLSTGEGGNSMTVRAGDMLDDTMKVTRINAQGVTLYSTDEKTERFLRISMSGGAS
ncbi:MAG: type IV pilus biogenesis protein PilP [Alphaproteobacteria bacterium]|nr:type IV pilus biogenesis protein PilP [Alphaproteobacteria bacterium]